jgi:Na+/H+ antiporter NhaA/protein-disulfide isomerase
VANRPQPKSSKAESERRSDVTTWSVGSLDFVRGLLGDHRSGTVAIVAAMAVSLAWANIAPEAYDQFWEMDVEVVFGTHSAALPLREIVNQGLMTLFFFVVGLEARREWDLGDLRDRRRSLLPLAVGIVALAVPALIFVLINLLSEAGSPHAWGTAMSTDTAMALGALSLLSRGASPRVRQFLVTVLVADDIGALVLIAVFYSDEVQASMLVMACCAFVAFWWLQRCQASWFWLAVVGSIAWLLTRSSGIDPIISGLILGVASPAYRPALSELEHASLGMRSFREQPSAAAARAAIADLRAAVSPNAYLQHHLAGIVGLLVVPVFVTANLGIRLNSALLHDAFTDPITWGIMAGLLLGKLLTYLVVPSAIRAATRDMIVAPVPLGDVVTVGFISSMGFTVTVLVATTALDGPAFDHAVVGSLAVLLVAPVLALGWIALTRALPSRIKNVLFRPGSPVLIDLVAAVDETSDHLRGSAQAGVTIVEYGDFECPFCGRAEKSLATVLSRLPADVRYVWRHLPLSDVHPAAWRAALASEAAAAQGAFWPMHDALLDQRDALEELDLVALASSLGLDTDRFVADFESPRTVQKVVTDIETARLSGVAGTPTLFINGVRYDGDYAPAPLLDAVISALAFGTARPQAG